MNNGPEIHDEKGIECMRASGKLAAQVLKFAGTLVKVMLLLHLVPVILFNWWNITFTRETSFHSSITLLREKSIPSK
jgi:hypothetical protein